MQRLMTSQARRQMLYSRLLCDVARATRRTGGYRRPLCKRASAILHNVPEYAKPRRCY